MANLDSRVFSIALALLTAGSIAGCSIGEKIIARNETKRSAESYQQCMETNATAPQQCETLRLALEEAERKQNSISTDLNIKPGAPPPTFGSAE